MVCSIPPLSLSLTYMQALTGDGKEELGLETSLTSFATVSHVVTLVPSSPAVNMSLRGQLAYRDAMATQKRLFFDASIHTSDLIRYTCTSTDLQVDRWTDGWTDQKTDKQTYKEYFRNTGSHPELN